MHDTLHDAILFDTLRIDDWVSAAVTRYR
jgi:hypothetical protein